MTIKFSLYKMNEFYFSSGRKLNLFETCTFLPENKKLTINLLLILMSKQKVSSGQNNSENVNVAF